MRATILLFPQLLLAGCLIGVPSLKGADSRPSLVGDDEGIVLVAPQGAAPLYARAGSEVVVDLVASLPLAVEADPEDPDAPRTRVRMDADELVYVSQTVDADAHPVYRFALTLTGEEGTSAKSVRADLVSAFDADLRAVVQSKELFLADFRAPEAACILSPRVAGKGDTVTLRITLSEDLAGGAPVVTSSDPSLTVAKVEQAQGRQWLATLEAPPDTNLDGYTLSVTGADPAGNPQAGDSMCALEDRTGTILGRGPRIADAGVGLEITPDRSVVVDDVPWVRTVAGDPTLITVTLPTVDPLAGEGNVVTLSGLPLTPAPDDPNTWTLVVDGDEGDGLKTLQAELVDRAGNLLTLRREGFLRLDLTPPAADCVLAPRAAKGSDRVVLQVFASEPLQELTPVVTADSADLVVTALGSLGNQHRFEVGLAQPVDVPAYVLTVLAHDRAGNLPAGGSLCDVQDRSGSLLGRPPLLDGEVVVTATPAVDQDGTPTVRAGATVTVTLPTDKPLDPAVSLVSLSGAPLTSQPDGTWTRVLDGTEGDGLKNLDAQLFDTAGNRLLVQRSAVLRFDFSPPVAASAVLSRSPFFAPAVTAGGRRVAFNDADPLTGQTPQVTVTVFASEALAGTTSLVVAGSPGPAVLQATVDGNVATFSRAGVADLPEGVYDLTVTLQDRVGNVAQDVPLALELVVDRSGPTELLDVDTLDRIVYTRLPWGSTDTAGQTRFELNGQAGAALPGATVVARAANGSYLGSVVSDDEGAFTALRSPADLANVYVSQLDEAGNASPSVRVRDVEWVATLGGKVPGDDVGNPHVILGASAFDGTGSPRGLAELTVVPEPGAPAVTPGGMVWTRVDPAGQPSARLAPVAVSDPQLGVMMTFGGITQTPFEHVDTVYVHDGYSWQDVSPPGGGPSGRWGAGLAWDPIGQRVLMYGGGTFTNTFGDTWAWGTAAWERLSPSGPLPGPRNGPSMATHPTRARVVLFGGRSDQDDPLGDTWTWNGSAWSRLDLTGPQPPARYGAPLVWDRVREELVLFGGNVDASSVMGDTWTFDGEAWRPRPPQGGPGPLPRQQHAMGWDPISERVLLIGGRDPGYTPLGDVWAWDGASWVKLAPTGGPATISEHAVGNDPVTGELLLFAGRGAGNVYNQSVWAWTGADWEDRSLVASPTPASAVMAYDEIREETILFLGEATPETWRWDGQRWTKLTGAGPTPPGRSRSAMVWDPREEELVLFGGRGNTSAFLQDTWAWTGAGWAPRTSVSRPSARWSHSLAGTPEGVVLVGGGVSGGGSFADQWVWVDGEWIEVTDPSGPGATSEHASAFDAARDEVLVRLASGASDALRAFDGQDWSIVSEGSPAPSARRFGRLTYDPLRRRTYLFGGEDAQERDGDLWSWDGDGWTLESPVGTRAGKRTEHAQAFDRARGQLVVFGPSPSTGDAVFTYLLDTGARKRPVQQLSIDWTYAGAAGSTVRRIETRLVAGGTGYQVNGAASHGARLYLWDVDHWESVGANDASSASPDVLCASVRASDAPDASAGCSDVVDGLLAPRLAVGAPRKAMRIAVTPRAVSNHGGEEEDWATVALEDVEVAVRYRLPAE